MQKTNGFTLIEMMVTLAVAIILLAVGVPLAQQMQAHSRITAETNTLVSALMLARTEAVSRGMPVAVCPKATKAPADTTCGAADKWINGWLVFTDQGNTSGSYHSGTETLIRTFEAASGSATITASKAAIRFTRDGRLDAFHTAVPETFDVAQTSNAKYHNCMTINRVGQVRTDRTDTGTNCP